MALLNFPSFIFPDNGGRYTYERQPEICKWNVRKLCETLQNFISSADVQDIMTAFDKAYNEAYLKKSREKVNYYFPIYDSL